MSSQNSWSMWNNSKNKSVENNTFSNSNQYAGNAAASAVGGGQSYLDNTLGSSYTALTGWQGNNTSDNWGSSFDELVDVTPFINTVSPMLIREGIIRIVWMISG